MDLLADHLMHLMTDDDGVIMNDSGIETMLAGSVLADLVLRGAVELRPKESYDSDPEVVLLNNAWLDDPLLTSAAQELSGKPRKSSTAVETLSSGLRQVLLARLEVKGAAREQNKRFLKVFPHSTWTLTSKTHRDRLRSELTERLRSGEYPGERGAALLSLLDTVARLGDALDPQASDRTVLLTRAKQVALESVAGGPVSESLRIAMEAATTAIAASFIVTSVSATGAATSS